MVCCAASRDTGPRETGPSGAGLRHYGLLHPATSDVAAALAPLVASRLADGEPILAVLPATVIGGLRSRLPATDLAGLRTADSGELCRHPGRVLGRYRKWIAELSPNGGPVTIVTAPDLGGGDPHRAMLWLQVDAVTTVALAECDLTLICVYPDDPDTGRAVRGAHPSLLNGAITPSPEHLPAEEFLARYPLPPPIELGEPDITHTIDHSAQLSTLRRSVTAYAARAGLPPARCDDFVLAASEIASNALEHGAPPATVSLWTTATSVICQITDTGTYAPPLARLLHSSTNQRRGRGLLLARQLCDQFYLWPHPTTIRLHMDRN
ncbi:MAG: ATP-binding protein [Pseudonocardiaceae bacterium]